MSGSLEGKHPRGHEAQMLRQHHRSFAMVLLHSPCSHGRSYWPEWCFTFTRGVLIVSSLLREGDVIVSHQILYEIKNGKTF